MSAPWLSVIGIGDDGLDGLPAATRRLIEDAEVLVGGDRHLAFLPPDRRERIGWMTPLSALVDAILARRDRRVCVLASGDPMDFGIGVTLARRLAEQGMADGMIVVPAPSAASLACARLGWPRAATETVTLHGRPPALLHAFIQPGARLLILSENGTTPQIVAEMLAGRRHGNSRMVVLEHMGGPRERRLEATAATWAAPEGGIADLNLIAVECRADPGAPLLARAPGLPDDAFRHDGQLTKREVRAVTLSALMPVAGQRLWDVGAGCGSIAIEWLRHHPTCRAIAIEPSAGRRGLIADNATALGCPGLQVVAGKAPAALDGLARPDAVFIGGGVAEPGVLDTCWAALPSGGRLVANSVTLEGEQALMSFQQAHGGPLTRIAISRAEPLGGRTGWRALRPVTQLAAIRP